MIEEKVIKAKDKEQKGILEHFCWRKDESKSTKSKLIYTRDSEIPYYNEITRYEKKFEEIQKEVIPQYKLHTLLFVFMTLMLIVPGLIYKIVVNNHNARIEEHNNKLYEEMEEILDKASQYTNI